MNKEPNNIKWKDKRQQAITTDENYFLFVYRFVKHNWKFFIGLVVGILITYVVLS